MNGSCARVSRRLRIGFCAGLLLLSSIGVPAAHADPWIAAKGHGLFEPMLRYSTAERAFSKTDFGTGTHPASSQRETQVRITGTYGIGARLSIDYDLRAGTVEERRQQAGQTVTSRSSGAEDQEIGLNLGLRQTQAFADSMVVNAIVPSGSTARVPVLGAGKAAIELDYQLGLANGPMIATLIAGPRVFVDGGAVQLRTTLSLGFMVMPRLRLSGNVFYVRTHHRQPVIAVADRGEIYNLLRVGVKLEYRPAGTFRHWHPFIGYQDSIAGKGIHAGQRFLVGCAIHY